MHLIILVACLSVFLICCYTTYRHFTRISVAGVRGPESSSWLLGAPSTAVNGDPPNFRLLAGNMPQLFGGQVGEVFKLWHAFLLVFELTFDLGTL
jgi:hypothetical protein